MSRIFLFFAMFVPVFSFSQEGFRLGLVKGKYANYRCSLHSQKESCVKLEEEKFVVEERETTYPNIWDVWNIHNPDTLVKIGEKVYLKDNGELELRIAKILCKSLYLCELNKLTKTNDNIILTMRIGNNKNKLLQITRFTFWNSLLYEGDSLAHNNFWLTLSPDRLYELEKAILNELIVPDVYYEFYGTFDFSIMLTNSDICNFEEIKKKSNKGTHSTLTK